MQPRDLDQFDNEEDELWPLRTDIESNVKPTRRLDHWKWLDEFRVYGTDPFDGTRFRDD